MEETDSFLIEFQLTDSRDVSPAEFRYLFAAIDDITRALVIEQMRRFVEMADLTDREQGEIYTHLLHFAPSIPPPVEVLSVRRESPWAVLIGLPVAGVMWAMRRMIAPEILQAWNETKLRETFRKFVRDGLFLGAKEQLEAGAASKPQYGNLAIDNVTSARSPEQEHPGIRVALRRTELLEVEANDRELMNDFLVRIGMKPK